MTTKTMIVYVPISWDRVHRSFFKSFVEMTSFEVMKELAEKGVSVKFLIDESFPLDYSRNKAVEMFLHYKADYLVCLDADMVFPRNTLLNLLDSVTEEYPVVTGNYHKKAHPNQSVAGWYVQNSEVPLDALSTLTLWGFIDPRGSQTLLYRSCGDFSKNRPFPVDVSGGGCLLIAKSAFEKLKQPYFKYFDHFLNAGLGIGNITEDMYFFSECKKAGVGVRLDPRIQCGHLSEKEITFMDQDLAGMAVAVPS